MEWVATRNRAAWPITQMPPMSSPRTRSFILLKKHNGAESVERASGELL